MSQLPTRMDTIETAMKFELVASKKLRLECEKLAQQVHELQVICKKLRDFVSTIKITPSMFKLE